VFDSNGYFLTPTSQFLSDLGTMLTLAGNNGIKVLISLFSFECANNVECHNMITDPNKNTPFINNALTTILDYINNNGLSSHVFAFEMFNEPEHMIISDLSGNIGASVSDDVKIPLAQVQSFSSKCNSVI